MKRPNKLKCLYLAITFQSSLTFAGNTRSLPKKEASERSSNWVCTGLALKFKDLTGNGVQGQTYYWTLSSVTKEKSFMTLTPVQPHLSWTWLHQWASVPSTETTWCQSFFSSLMTAKNKLECLSLADIIMINCYLWVRPDSTRVDRLG